MTNRVFRATIAVVYMLAVGRVALAEESQFLTAKHLRVGRSPSSIVVADFNGDGKLDIAAANSGSDNISVLLGNGNGSFQNARSFPAGPQPAAIASRI